MILVYNFTCIGCGVKPVQPTLHLNECLQKHRKREIPLLYPQTKSRCISCDEEFFQERRR